MTRTLTMVALVVSAMPCAWAGDTKLKVTGPDGLEGTAKLTNTVQADGTKYVRLSMNLKYGNGQTVDVLQESSYTREGTPVRMLQASKSLGKKTSIVVTFSDEGAQVVADKGDGPKTNMVVNPPGSTANPTEFWFVKTMPRVGQSVEYYTFRVSEQAWAKVASKYEGKKDIVVAGKRVSAHFVQMGEVKTYLDDKGDPYRIELGQLTLERTAD